MEQIWTTSVGKENGINLLNAHAQWHYGVTEPTTTYPFQNWGDTTNNLWKQRNESNDGWIIRGKLSDAYFGLAPTNTVVPIDGWIPLSSTLTYVSSTAFTYPADLTNTFQKGYGIKFTQNGVVKFFYNIAAPSYSTPNSTITVSTGNDISGNIVTVENTATYPISNAYWTPNPMAAFKFPMSFNYNPTITAESGTITTLGTVTCKFTVIGGLVDFYVSIGVTNKGSASGALKSTLPIIPSIINYIGFGRETGTTGKMVQGAFSTTGTVSIFTYDNLTIIDSGYRINLNGRYPF